MYGWTMQLVLLNVSNNKLEFLPESIGSCFSLEELQANGTLKSLSLHFHLPQHPPRELLLSMQWFKEHCKVHEQYAAVNIRSKIVEINEGKISNNDRGHVKQSCHVKIITVPKL